MRRLRRQQGFTLVELMVVIGIMAALTAITVPVATSLSRGNKMITCASRMQRIGQAMKIYTLDEGSAPPYYPELDAGGAYTGNMVGTGLMGLIDAGYLSGIQTLHCPADYAHGRNNPLYAYSYYSQDTDASYEPSNLYGDRNQLKYLSCRGIARNAGDPDFTRQVCELEQAATDYHPIDRLTPIFSREWHPNDSTVLLWCNFHHHQVKRAGEGQYQVLFWDGSARRMPGSLFRNGTAVPEAWRVDPSDDPTP